MNSPHGVSAGVWVGAGSSLSEVQSLLEKLVPQFLEEKTELFRALIQQLGNVGSQQIRNVAVCSACSCCFLQSLLKSREPS